MSTVKAEFVRRSTFKTRDQARLAVFSYIERLLRPAAPPLGARLLERVEFEEKMDEKQASVWSPHEKVSVSRKAPHELRPGPWEEAVAMDALEAWIWHVPSSDEPVTSWRWCRRWESNPHPA